jgi:hypothetical protein
LTRNRYQKTKQCCGVVRKYNDRSRKHRVKTERCQVFVSNAQLEACVNPKQDMCYMHCDCEGCSSKYTKTHNRGKRYTELETEHIVHRLYENLGYEEIIMKEKDIEKLRAVCLTLNSKFPYLMTSIVKASKETLVVYQKQKEIEKYENHIKQLRRELNEIRSE